jgi:hypothetical protein
MICREAVPTLSADVITRKDTNGVLLFHVASDEMYLIPEQGHALLMLFDGSRTLGEIEDDLADANESQRRSDISTALDTFLTELGRRGIVELWGPT